VVAAGKPTKKMMLGYRKDLYALPRTTQILVYSQGAKEMNGPMGKPGLLV
jgi:hypothetical protein